MSGISCPECETEMVSELGDVRRCPECGTTDRPAPAVDAGAPDLNCLSDAIRVGVYESEEPRNRIAAMAALRTLLATVTALASQRAARARAEQDTADDARGATRGLSDAELFDGLLRHYAAAEFADEQFPGQTVLKFAFPNGAAVGADLRATLARLAAAETSRGKA